MRFKGIVSQWNDERGFGFIAPAEGGERVFCHISAFRHRAARPVVGQRVTYELTRDDRGRPRAADIRDTAAARRAEPQQPAPPRRGAAIAGAGIFMIVVAVLVVLGRLPWQVLSWYLGASVFTYFAYGWDKVSAKMKAWRTQEATLSLLALIGGWPGGCVGQHWFRHKTRKTSFLVQFWIAVVLNVLALGWVVVSRASGGLF